ncbi:MAG: tetratricopeptide repeat protein [Candidatus Thiodiazotropha sp. (ex Ustalcina ferruginea)]|nr:tetratricopeptide repeat protein [Candidatus Thiodiazotropha sp. (ex Ustalcina ferruginea)]
MTQAANKTVDTVLKARKFLKRDQYGEAERCISDTLNNSVDADEASLYAAMAEIRNQQRDFDTAQEFVGKSLSLSPENSEAKLQLAIASLGRLELDTTEVLLSEIETEKKKDARFLAQQARIHHLRHKQEKAVEYIDRAIRFCPRHAGYHALKAELLLAATPLSNSKIKQAITAARKAKQIDKTDHEAWRVLIKALLISGNQDEFSRMLRDARKILTGSATVDTEVAEFLIRNKRYMEAENALSEIVRTYPDFPPAYQALADLYIGTEQWGKAIEVGYKALAFAPYDLRTWRLTGQALAMNGELTLAMGWLLKVLVADSDDLLTASVLADVLHRLHEFNAAEDLYRQILKEMTTPALLNSYGVLLMDMERNSEASETLRRAYSMDRDSYQIQMNLATALTNAGEFQAAREIYLDIMVHKPELGEAFLYYTSNNKNG